MTLQKGGDVHGNSQAQDAERYSREERANVQL